MNKTELVAALAEKTQLPKKNAELALNAVVEVITESLSKGDKVQIVGFFHIRRNHPYVRSSLLSIGYRKNNSNW